jgi:hypothetical protein
MWLTLSIINTQGKENIPDLVTDFDLSAVTDQLGQGITAVNVILEGVDKLYVALHTSTLVMKDLVLKNLGSSLPTTKSKCVRIDSVGSNRFVMPMNIKGRIGRLVHYRLWRTVLMGIWVNCIVTSKVCLMTSVGRQPRKG